MTPLTALALATPLFGLSLTPPSMGPAPMPVFPAPAVPVDIGALEATARGAEAPAVDPREAAAEVEAGPSMGEQLAQRQRVARIHKWLGISTWSAMTVTMILGGIQYHNLYGAFDGRGSNPCVQGDAIFGQGQCTGTPWPHALSAAVTTGLYAATFTLSYFMPDPLDVAEQDSEAGRRLRTHKLLRWVHFGGMIAQAVLGVVVANGERFGLDRANDYRALQGLATVHLISGMVTYGALTWAGALMLF